MPRKGRRRCIGVGNIFEPSVHPLSFSARSNPESRAGAQQSGMQYLGRHAWTTTGAGRFSQALAPGADVEWMISVSDRFYHLFRGVTCVGGVKLDWHGHWGSPYSLATRPARMQIFCLLL